MQSIEPALGRALATHTPCGHWCDEAFQLHVAQFLVLEYPADQLVCACSDYDTAWFRQGLQPRGKIWRLAHDTALAGLAGTDKIAHNDEACGNASAHPQAPARCSRRQPRGRHNLQTGTNRPLGIVLMRLRVAEVGQYSVAHILGDKAIEAADHHRNVIVVLADHLAQVFWIES